MAKKLEFTTIKIISDGTSLGTQIITDKGSLITGVKKVRYEIDVGDKPSKCFLYVIKPELEIVISSKIAKFNIYHKNGFLNKLIAIWNIIKG